jgi:hypothetical protein
LNFNKLKHVINIIIRIRDTCITVYLGEEFDGGEGSFGGRTRRSSEVTAGMKRGRGEKEGKKGE